MLKAFVDHFLYKPDEDTGAVVGPICQQVSVFLRITDLFTGLITLIIELWVDGVKKYFPLDRRLLYKKKCLSDMEGQGLTLYFPEDEDDLMAYLLQSDQCAPDITQHKKLGFYTIDDHLVFLANRMIGHPDKDSCYY